MVKESDMGEECCSVGIFVGCVYHVQCVFSPKLENSHAGGILEGKFLGQHEIAGENCETVRVCCCALIA